MNTESNKKNSQLVAALREGIGVVQMVVFKEVRANLTSKRSDLDKPQISMLAGSITNEIFGSQNPEVKFALFRKDNWGEIEQELLSLKDDLPNLCNHINDALRIQTLCDHQEGGDSSTTLIRAKKFGFLLEELEIPLPSSFMSTVRELGNQHNLIIPPIEITAEQDNSMVH